MNVYRDKESDLQMFNYCSNSLHRNTYLFDMNSIVFKEDSFVKRIKEVEKVEKTEDVWFTLFRRLRMLFLAYRESTITSK